MNGADFFNDIIIGLATFAREIGKPVHPVGQPFAGIAAQGGDAGFYAVDGAQHFGVCS